MRDFLKQIKTFVDKHRLRPYIFPLVILIIILTLASLRLHGSSIGVYHQMFYGLTSHDENLLVNNPRPIRSDEWLVNSQKAYAQSVNDYRPINTNQGNGENIRLLADAPYRDWSIVFKPHNIGFLVLPFDIAFSLKWWLVLAIPILGAYVFFLAILRRKYLLSSLLSVAVGFSPFIFWWYTYGTGASIGYVLFAVGLIVHLIRSSSKRTSLLLSTALAYIGTAFALVLYPPFQIPCALVGFFFLVGFTFDYIRKNKVLHVKFKILSFIAAIVLCLLLVLLFLKQNAQVVSLISNSSYPGSRVVESGGFNALHFITNNTQPLLQNQDRAVNYKLTGVAGTNPSESSNFILFFIPLVPFVLFMLVKYWKQLTYRVTLAILLGLFGIFLCWEFIPGLTEIGKFMLLDKVPKERLLIGFGVINAVILAITIISVQEMKYKMRHQSAVIYASVVFIIWVALDYFVMRQSPNYLGLKTVVLFAVPFAITTYFILVRRPTIAALVIAGFSITSVYAVHPIYRGTQVFSNDPLINKIHEIGSGSQKRWAVDYLPIENFTAMAGVPSLSGTYTYPQTGLWSALNKPDEYYKYNRYAHVGFTFDRDPNISSETIIRQATTDQFNIYIEPCDSFLKKDNVGFIISSLPLDKQAAPCLRYRAEVAYPSITFYIYELM